MGKDKKKDKKEKEIKTNDSVKTGDELKVNLQPGKEDPENKTGNESDSRETKNNDNEESKMAKDKDKENEKEETGVVKMIWMHRKETPGQHGTVFGFPAVANKDGFFIVDVPAGMVKNEMKRVQKLIPYDLYLKRKELEDEAAALYE